MRPEACGVVPFLLLTARQVLEQEAAQGRLELQEAQARAKKLATGR